MEFMRQIKKTTDLMIAQMLVEKGIPKSDIVLALQSPETRKLSGYAVV